VSSVVHGDLVGGDEDRTSRPGLRENIVQVLDVAGVLAENLALFLQRRQSGQLWGFWTEMRDKPIRESFKFWKLRM